MHTHLAAGVQAHHAQAHTRIEHLLHGFRVHGCVEFGRGRMVARAGTATHPDQCADAAGQRGLGLQQERQVGQRAEGQHRGGGCCDLQVLSQRAHCVVRGQRPLGCRQAAARRSHGIRPQDVLRRHQRPHQRLRATPVDGHLPAEAGGGTQSVVLYHLHGRVARDQRQAVDAPARRVRYREHGGQVVETHVGVDPHVLFRGCHGQLPSCCWRVGSGTGVAASRRCV